MDNRVRIPSTTPDGKQTKLFNAWRCMIKRCYSPNESMYYRYGGRGITVCEEWLGADGFQAFAHDMGEPPNKAMSLDRIDNAGDYHKENCRWATRMEQNRNTTRNRTIEIDGVTRCLEEWAGISKVSSHCIAKRLRRGWSAKEAVFSGDSHKGVKRKKRREREPQVGVSPVYSKDGSTPTPPPPLIGKHERLVEIDGVTKPLQDWCKETGVDPKVFSDRLKRKWNPKDALFTPTLGVGHKRPGIRKLVTPSDAHPVPA